MMKTTQYPKHKALLAGGPGSSKLTRLLRQKELHILMAPGLLIMIVFRFFPMFGLLIAFQDYQIVSGLRGFFHSNWVGLRNFADFFHDPKSSVVIVNTIAMSFLRIGINFPIVITFALFLNEIKSVRFKSMIQTVSYLPHFISWVIFGGLIMRILSSDGGIVNDILLKMKLINQPIFFMGQPKYFWFVAVFTSLIKEIGWSAILYLAAIAGIDQQLYEAATVDGAGRFKKMWHITLPCISGTIIVLLLLAVANFIRESFDQIWVLQNPLNLARSEIIGTYVYKVGLTQARFSYATAVGLFQSVVALLMLLFSNFLSNRLTGKGLY